MSQQGPIPTETPSEPRKSSPPARRRGFKRWVFLALVLFGAGAVAHVWYWGSRIEPHVYSAEELRQGPRWQVISWGGDRTAVEVSRLSSLAADHLWRVVTDQGGFDEFMPYVRRSTVEPGPQGTFIEKQILDLPYKSYDLTLEIRLEERGGVRTARWRQIQGDLSFNEGAWVVEVDGNRTILRYQVSASVGALPQWAINYVMARRLGRLLEAVEARVRDLESRAPDYFRR